MELWKAHLLTDKEKKYRDFCIEEGYLAIGWPINKNKNYKDFNTYKIKAKELYKTNEEKYKCYGEAFDRATKAINDIKKGDYCWTSGSDGKYYLGVIKDDKPNCEKIDDYSEIGCYRKVYEWKNFELDEVPGDIINQFKRKTQTLSKILKNKNFILSYSNYLLTGDNKLMKNFIKKNKTSLEIFSSLMHWDDWEDLIGIYLQKEENYIYFPSTNKNSTSVIEYMLINKNTHKKAVVQCKSGDAEIDNDNELINGKYKDYEIYLFVENGKFPNTDYKNIHKRTKDFLYNWSLKEKNILTDRIKKYLDFSNL